MDKPPATAAKSAQIASADVRSRRDAAVAWLMSRINYERVAVIPYNERQLKLDRMRQLLTRLGSPDAGQKIIHIAGTKGKGSTATLVAAMLTASGLRTGVYSSPHLERIEERWSIDGQPCHAEALISLVERMRPVVEAIDAESARDPEGVGPPTFFDITTAMALVHFADEQCDAAVLEVGLGGRLDSTNVCLPTVSVITSISLDHTRQLGDTLAAIASEKAGIIKPGVPVVSGVVDTEPREVITSIAHARGCRLIQRERDFGTETEATASGSFAYWRETTTGRDELANLQLALLGAHQTANAAVALAVIGELRDQGWAISTDACRAGLATAKLPARVEWFPAVPDARPAVVVDTAHNEASAQALVESLHHAGASNANTPGPRTLILAISRDKQVEQIAQTLAPAFDRVIATRFVENPRAVDPTELAAMLPRADQISVADDPQTAWRMAIAQTPADGLIVVSGSFFIAAELRPVVCAASAGVADV